MRQPGNAVFPDASGSPAVGEGSDPTVSIVIPVLNEAGNIDPLVEAVFAATSGNRLGVELIFVDDGSEDGTPDRIRAWQQKHPVRLIERDCKDGLAGAVLAGAGASSNDTVIVMDGDLSHPPERIAALAEPVLAGECDMVIGSRYARGGATPGWPWHRRAASRLAALLAWPLTDVRDALGGFFAVRRERLLELTKDAAGFKIALELLVRGGRGLRVKEIPIIFRDRARGQSKMGARVIHTYVRRLLALAGMPIDHLRRFLLLSIPGVIVDFALFYLLMAKGVPIGTAHIFSFLVAACVNYVLKTRPAMLESERKHPANRLRVQGSLLLVAAAALFLRGGVLAMLSQVAGWPPQVAFVFAVAATIAVTLFGNAFCLSASGHHYGPGMGWRVAAVSVTAYLFALRLVYLGAPNLMPEEAYYWNYSQHLSLGYLDHPPMVAWIIRLGTGIFGNNEFGVRIGAFVCWLITSRFVYRLARDLFDKSSALVAVLLLQVLPFYLSTGLLMTPDAPLTACWAGALYFLERVFIRGRAGAWWGVGVCMGLGMVSKYTIGLLGLATLVFMALDSGARRWLFRWQPYAATMVGIALFSPVIIWNAQNDWASFAFQSSRRLAEPPEFSLHALIGSILVVLTPTGFAAALAALLAARLRWKQSSRALFALVYTLVPLSVFVVFSLRHEVKLEWTGPLWLAILPGVAAMMTSIPKPGETQTRLARWVQKAWGPTIVFMTLAYGAGFHYLALGLPGVPYSESMELAPVGWRELGRQIDAVEKEVAQETGSAPLVVGLDRYFTSSETAFYSAGKDEHPQPTGGAHFFGKLGLMYERWMPAADATGRTVLFVGWNKDEVARSKLEKRFHRVGPVQEGRIERDGKFVRDFFFRVGYGYRSPHPERGQ